MGTPSLADDILPPEFDEAKYRIEVLRLTDGQTEDEYDAELAALAAELGISFPEQAPSPVPGSDTTPTESAQQQQPPPGAECDADAAGAGSTVGPGSSTLPEQSPGTDRGQHRSDRTSLPQLITRDDVTSPPSAPRRRPRVASFSIYDRYIAQLDPALSQPKFLEQQPPPQQQQAHPDSSPGIFGAGARKSYRNLTDGLKTKILFRRRSSLAHAPTYVMLSPFTSTTPPPWPIW